MDVEDTHYLADQEGNVNIPGMLWDNSETVYKYLRPRDLESNQTLIPNCWNC